MAEGTDTHKVTLLLLDGVDVVLGAERHRLAGRKSRALLAYLACSARSAHSRDRLAGLFWPDVTVRQGRASLRQCLFDIRKLLGAQAEHVFVLNKDDLRVHQDRFALDTERFLGAVSRGTAAPEELAILERLEGVLPICEAISAELDAWLAQTRAELCQRAIEALQAGAKVAEVPVAQRLRLAAGARGLDPYNEAVARQLMRLHVEAGENSAALRVYDDLYQRLEDELDVEPSAQTQKLAVEIKLLEPPTTPTRNVQPELSGSGLAQEGVAVLPFDIIGPYELPQYVALGLLDEITCLLASAALPRIISSNSTRQFAGTVPDPKAVGAALGVRYLVIGSIRHLPDATSVTTQLVDTRTSTIERARVDRCSDRDLFAHQSDLAIRIAATVMPSLQLAELRRTRHRDIDDLEPFHLFLRARESLFNLDQGGFETARSLLERAIGMAPYFPQAYSLLAEWHSINIWQGWSGDPVESGHELERLARQALSLNPDDARSLSLLAHNRVTTHRQYDEAAQMFARAVEILPNDAETLIWTVPTLAFTEQAQKGIENGERALWLSPQDPFLFRNLHFLSIAQFADGAFEDAARSGRRAHDLNPSYRSNMRMTIAALVRSGDMPAARKMAGQYLELEPEFRASAHMEKVAFRRASQRESYGASLIEAGLPA